ncbi:type 1 glutamine amidotransferase [Aspergillus mulundensis]|uniref:Class I glutamine amidotransferase-like protein n=1 Tax=Aspergillus mulundensis TaxID=1810919 RepID=A0A3D8QRM3_9EURO|nr:Class I glutamine amidotransferase-like protein [Aspergillus mulundensis]RDW64473.1 Class I glutamine amidotransferase-like protein [Aspergillus mulundensis]
MDQTYKPTPTAPVIRLLVLETDKPHPDTYSERGSFGRIIHEHFSAAGAAHHPPLGVETDQVFVVSEQGGRVPKVSELDSFDGLLITGSVYDAHANNEWILQLLDLLRTLWLMRPGFRFLGVCFGHQLLARLLGGEVGPAPSRDWELGHCRITLTSTGQRLFRTHEDFVHLHQMHQDQVVKAPSAESAGGLVPADTEISVWGRSEHTPFQGLYIPNRLFTTQAHLAFDEDMVKRQIQIRVDSGSIRDLEHADRAAETADLEHDGVEVAKAILRLFVKDEDEF